MSRVSNKRYFVYILWSDSGCCFYIGISIDPARRLEQHHAGAYRGWTNQYRSWILVYTEEHQQYSAARRRELTLKAQKGGAGFFAMTGLDARRFRR